MLILAVLSSNRTFCCKLDYILLWRFHISQFTAVFISWPFKSCLLITGHRPSRSLRYLQYRLTLCICLSFRPVLIFLQAVEKHSLYIWRFSFIKQHILIQFSYLFSFILYYSFLLPVLFWTFFRPAVQQSLTAELCTWITMMFNQVFALRR